MKRTAYIIGAGDFCSTGFHPTHHDLVIAADGGYTALRNIGHTPDVLLGDLDSLHKRPKGVRVLKFPAKKNETDMALGIRLAISRGFTQFKLFGALGGRQDHGLANLQLLAGIANQGYQGMMIAPGLVVRVLHQGTLALSPRKKGSLLSVFAWGCEAKGVKLSRVKYPLKNARLNAFEPLGISNEFLGIPALVSVREGTLIIFMSSNA